MRSGLPHYVQVSILPCVTHATPAATESRRDDQRDQDISLKEDLGRDLKAINKPVRDACGPLLESTTDEKLCVIHHSLSEFSTGFTRAREENEAAFPISDPSSTNVRVAEACI